MKRLIAFSIILCLAIFLGWPSNQFWHVHHTWTNVVSSIATTCTSGTTCGPSVTLTCSATELCVVAGTMATGQALSSCCGGSGCTWVSDINHTASSQSTIIYHSVSCTVTSTTIGPTWGGACAAGPTCHSGVMEWTSSTGTIALNGTPVSTSTFTWGTPTSMTSANSIVVSAIDTSGDATGCSGGTSPTCSADANGNAIGWENNITSYSAPSWTGSSGTNNVGTAAYKEAAAAGGVRGFPSVY